MSRFSPGEWPLAPPWSWGFTGSRIVAAAPPFDNGLLVNPWAVDQGFTLNHVGGATDLYIATEDTGPGHVLENQPVPLAAASDLQWTFKMRVKPGSPVRQNCTFEQYQDGTGNGEHIAGIISLTDSGQAWLHQGTGFVVGTITNTLIADDWHDVTITYHTPTPTGGAISCFVGTGFYSGDGASGIEFKEMVLEVV